jgi:hypothetical protein
MIADQPQGAERAAMLDAYRTVTSLERLSFEACLRSKALSICLKNLAEARRRRAAEASTDFRLVP